MERAQELAIIRRAYAKQILAEVQVDDPALELAFTQVRREGSGPWVIPATAPGVRNEVFGLRMQLQASLVVLRARDKELLRNCRRADGGQEQKEYDHDDNLHLYPRPSAASTTALGVGVKCA
jgi:hypothetical protein